METACPHGLEEREMKFSTLAILFATAGMLGLSTAQGQYRFSGHTRRPVAQRSTFESSRYYQPGDESSPSDVPAPPPAAPANGYANGGPSCGCEPSCEAEPTCEAEPSCEAEP